VAEAGPVHRSTVVTESNLADTLMQENKYPEAEKLLSEALEIEGRTLGPQPGHAVLGDMS
jgi:hypothetical protein